MDRAMYYVTNESETFQTITGTGGAVAVAPGQPAIHVEMTPEGVEQARAIAGMVLRPMDENGVPEPQPNSAPRKRPARKGGKD